MQARQERSGISARTLAMKTLGLQWHLPLASTMLYLFLIATWKGQHVEWERTGIVVDMIDSGS